MQFCPAGNSQSKPPFLSVLELFYSSSRNRDKAMDVLCSDGSSPKRSSLSRALKVKIEPSQAHPKPFKQASTCSCCFIKTQIFYALLKKSSSSLGQSSALLKILSPNPKKMDGPRAETEPGLGSDPSLVLWLAGGGWIPGWI